MELALCIATVAFFYISLGTSELESKRARKYGEQLPSMAMNFIVLTKIATLVIPVFCYLRIFSIAWYWCILINIVGIFLLSSIFSIIYIKIFGRKTGEIYDFKEQKMINSNIYIVDSLITFIIGIVLFIIGIALF